MPSTALIALVSCAVSTSFSRYGGVCPRYVVYKVQAGEPVEDRIGNGTGLPGYRMFRDELARFDRGEPCEVLVECACPPVSLRGRFTAVRSGQVAGMDAKYKAALGIKMLSPATVYLAGERVRVVSEQPLRPRQCRPLLGRSLEHIRHPGGIV